MKTKQLTQKEVAHKKSIETLNDLVELAFNKYTEEQIFNAIEKIHWQKFDQMKQLFKMDICLNGAYIIDDVNLVQENDLKVFCKENDIKLINYWNV